ncbi:hypothetical protein G3813_000026 [Escherichia coli]|nr:hypothetical protein [Escherichia coli]
MTEFKSRWRGFVNCGGLFLLVSGSLKFLFTGRCTLVRIMYIMLNMVGLFLSSCVPLFQ